MTSRGSGRALPRLVLALAAVLICFAGNSLLARLAIRDGDLDPGTFSAVRLVAGSTMLVLLWWAGRRRRGRPEVLWRSGSWTSTVALVVYVLAMSYGYVRIDAGVGALVLFAVVQAVMTGWGIVTGHRVGPRRWVGLAVAGVGLVALLLPGAAAPSLLGVLLMAVAGAAWGVYSVRGAEGGDPLTATAANFTRSVPVAVLLGLAVIVLGLAEVQPAGLAYAVLSGAITSGVGYAIWYAVLPVLSPVVAATVQLGVPVLTLVAGAVLLAEGLSPAAVGASAVVVLGIALVAVPSTRRAATREP